MYYAINELDYFFHNLLTFAIKHNMTVFPLNHTVITPLCFTIKTGLQLKYNLTDRQTDGQKSENEGHKILT